MALPSGRQDREYKKFVENAAGDVAIRVVTTDAAGADMLKAEDAAHTSGDVGVMSLGVRKDTAAALAASDGDYIPFIFDANGKLWVNIGAVPGTAAMATSLPITHATDDTQLGAVGAAADVDGNVHGQLRYIGEAVDNLPALGTATMTGALPVTMATDDVVTTGIVKVADAVFVDDAAFTPATSKIIAIGAQADETATDSVDEGDAGALRMTLDRKLYTLSLPDPAPLFDSDADNSAQAIKASTGRLFSLDVINPNPTACYVQLFNAATASVTVGTTVPNYVIYVPANGSVSKDWPGLFFATAITYAATTTATGAGDPTTGLTLSASYL